MIPFARAVASGRYARVVAVTAAQSGKTDTLLDIIGHRIDQRPAPILYVGPSLEFNTTQFEPRLMELFDQAPALASKLIRGRRMKQTLKHIAGVRVRLAHAGSSTALKSDPAALAVVDEYDEMSKNVRGQGDVLGLVEARGETYADFTAAVTSTPSQGVAETEIDEVSGLEFWSPGDPSEIESRIWRLWQEGTRFHWAWSCPHCEEYFIPRMKCLSWTKDATPENAKRTAHLVCPNCAGEIYEESKAEMNRTGLMVAPGQRIENGRVIGSPPDSGTCSFWTSGLASPFRTWGQRAERIVTADRSGDPDRKQTAVNAGLGELYVPFDRGDLPSHEEILERREPYRLGELPDGVLRLVAGVDVQKNSLYYVIRGFGARGTSWLVNHGQIFGATAGDEVWLELAEMLLTPIDGLPIERMMVDSGYRPDKVDSGDLNKVYEFTRRYPRMAIPCKGAATAAVPIRFNEIEVTPRGRKSPVSLRLAHLDSDFFKSLVHSRLRIPESEPGALRLYMDADEDYARQMVSEIRVVTRGEKPKWVPIFRDNHYLDCEALAAAGGYLLGVQRIPEGVTRTGEFKEDAPADNGQASENTDNLTNDEDVVGAPPRIPAPPPVKKPGGGAGDIRSRFANKSATIR